jgi:hypothetical protein
MFLVSKRSSPKLLAQKQTALSSLSDWLGPVTRMCILSQGHCNIFPSHRKFRALGTHNTHFQSVVSKQFTPRHPIMCSVFINRVCTCYCQHFTPQLEIEAILVEMPNIPLRLLSPIYLRGDDVITATVHSAEGNCVPLRLSTFVLI